jgi:pheromone shutdown protein TraB
VKDKMSIKLIITDVQRMSPSCMNSLIDDRDAKIAIDKCCATGDELRKDEFFN